MSSQTENSNNKQTALLAVSGFLKSDDEFLFLSGTHQQEKHLVALAAILTTQPPSRILFRTNSADHCESFLRPILNLTKKPKRGEAIVVEGGHELFTDTMNSASWNKTPNDIDIAVLYPIDSYSPDTGSRSVQDVRMRGCKKILLVTWTDNRDFSWADNYSPRHVVYDAKEENPEYHEKMLEIASQPKRTHQLSGLPDYAKDVPHEFLIRVPCTKCHATRYARLNKPYPGESVLSDAEHGEYWARCLKCRTTAHDSYNWYR